MNFFAESRNYLSNSFVAHCTGSLLATCHVVAPRCAGPHGARALRQYAGSFEVAACAMRGRHIDRAHTGALRRVYLRDMCAQPTSAFELMQAT
eukprot:6207279-Pleurochrysis_carterae.AAC.3